MDQFLQIQPEVREAIESGQPVVALESTIISHGMPYPRNLDTAREVEALVRQGGAVPATIAIIGGKCHVGLSDSSLEELSLGKDAWKVSLRDIPYVIMKGLLGATTVAATMRIAAMAGIKVFVTGGIGGVHRGAENTMDISADLTEMSKTSVAVISAGVKSILDIGLTLEYLETQGIPAITMMQEEFPSFYSRNSGFRSPYTVSSAKEVASFLSVKWQLGLEGSVLVANPVPEDEEIPSGEMEAYIQDALLAAEKQKIKGKDITPFLLKFIADHTKGESLGSNIALVKHNAELGAAIAREFSLIK
jgi:pseudouridylate synthase